MDISGIGYCGIYCGSCPLRAGIEADAVMGFRKASREVGYDSHLDALGAVIYMKILAGCPVCLDLEGPSIRMRCPADCRAGGGNPVCRMRSCCLEKGILGCWECAAFETCDKLRGLAPAHGTAHLRNLRIISEKGVTAFLEGEKAFIDLDGESG